MDTKPANQARVFHPGIGPGWVTRVDVPGNDDIVFVTFDGRTMNDQVLWAELEYRPLDMPDDGTGYDDVLETNRLLDEGLGDDPAMTDSFTAVGKVTIEMFKHDPGYWSHRWPTPLVAAVTEHIEVWG